MEPVIKSKLLSESSEVIHGVSTKAAGAPPFYNNMSRWVGDEMDSVLKNRIAFYSEIGADAQRTAHANQVHSNNSEIVSEPGLVKQTDALITAERGLFLVISVADCLPVMVYDKSKGVVANIHSGWRGTAAGIVTNTLQKMKHELCCRPEDMIAFVGPGIGKDRFEVGEEVAQMFGEKYVKRPPRLTAGEPSLLIKEGKFCIDLKSVVKDQLTAAGLYPENIEVSPCCTFTEKDRFHSYRRDKDKSGRMFAVIGMKK